MRTKLAFIVLLGFLMHACQTHEKIDFIVTAKAIYTVDESFNKVEAMAIHQGKIIATGSLEDILGKYSAVEAFSYPDQYLFPGFYDAHCHFLSYAEGLLSPNLVGTSSYREMVAKVQQFYGNEPTGWVLGRGWDQTTWANDSFPDNSLLDSLYPNNPVLLKRVDGHAALANSHALKLAGLDASSIVPGGKLMQRNGSLTGVLIDNAVEKVSKMVPDYAQQQRIAAVMDAQKRCFEAGLTSLGDAYSEQKDIEFLDSLQKTGDLKMRIYAMIAGDKPETVRYYEENGPYKTDLMNVRSVKVFFDGALGSRGALLLEDYSDAPGEKGLQLLEWDNYTRLLERSFRMGFQVNTHAIGDAANRTVLESYQSYLPTGNDLRWRVEHAQVVHPDDLAKFTEYNIIPSVQPTHATSDMPWAADRLGPERVKHAYAYKDLLKHAGFLPLGSDFPVEQISPILGLYAAVARKKPDGLAQNGFQTENALSREEAIRGFTIWAARAAFEENEKGSLEKGKWADFVVLDKDLMAVAEDSIPKAKIFETFVAGQRVYRKPIAPNSRP